jgi:hypothetical protein
MIFPVYNTDLSPERLDSYHTKMNEDDLAYIDACFGTIDARFGTIAVGCALDIDTNPYKIGKLPNKPEIIRTYDIVDVSHIMSVSKEALEEQGELSPDLRPYDEDPVSLKARGIYEGRRYAIAGIYYASNRLIGWMNIIPEHGLFRTLTRDEEARFFE